MFDMPPTQYTTTRLPRDSTKTYTSTTVIQLCKLLLQVCLLCHSSAISGSRITTVCHQESYTRVKILQCCYSGNIFQSISVIPSQLQDLPTTSVIPWYCQPHLPCIALLLLTSGECNRPCRFHHSTWIYRISGSWPCFTFLLSTLD